MSIPIARDLRYRQAVADTGWLPLLRVTRSEALRGSHSVCHKPRGTSGILTPRVAGVSGRERGYRNPSGRRLAKGRSGLDSGKGHPLPPPVHTVAWGTRQNFPQVFLVCFLIGGCDDV
jgi:hypothetical protein